jgi:Flp pilus assembly secretin CpaC
MWVRQWLGAIVAASLLALTLPAVAQQRMIEVAVNTAELLQLQAAPGSVLVANPAIADVVVEGGRHVFVLGKAPGETQLFVLDANGGTMLRAMVSVVPQTARHMNVIRGTEETQIHCAPRCAATPGQERRAAPAPAPAPASPAPAPATK